ncbi:hypothetical protein GCM10028828_03690 [Corynebacterium tapiri]
MVLQRLALSVNDQTTIRAAQWSVDKMEILTNPVFTSSVEDDLHRAQATVNLPTDAEWAELQKRDEYKGKPRPRGAVLPKGANVRATLTIAGVDSCEAAQAKFDIFTVPVSTVPNNPAVPSADPAPVIPAELGGLSAGVANPTLDGRLVTADKCVPAERTLNVGIMMDVSNSIKEQNIYGLMRESANGIVDGLKGANVNVSVHNFASYAPRFKDLDGAYYDANGNVNWSKGTVNYNLKSPEGVSAAKAQIGETYDRLKNLTNTSAGGTNWDAALEHLYYANYYRKQLNNSQYDVVYFITDGMPTRALINTTQGNNLPVAGDVLGTWSHVGDVKSAIESADALKRNFGTRIQPVLVNVPSDQSEVILNDFTAWWFKSNVDEFKRTYGKAPSFLVQNLDPSASYMFQAVRKGLLNAYQLGRGRGQVSPFGDPYYPVFAGLTRLRAQDLGPTSWAAMELTPNQTAEMISSVGTPVHVSKQADVVAEVRALVDKLRLDPSGLAECQPKPPENPDSGRVIVEKRVVDREGKLISDAGAGWEFEAVGVTQGGLGTRYITNHNRRWEAAYDGAAGKPLTIKEVVQDGYQFQDYTCTANLKEGTAIPAYDAAKATKPAAGAAEFNTVAPQPGSFTYCIVTNKQVDVHLNLYKVDQQNNVLKGAVFTLQPMIMGANGSLSPIQGKDPVALQQDANNPGKYVAKGLELGKVYRLTESKSPVGADGRPYSLLSKPIDFTFEQAKDQSGKTVLRMKLLGNSTSAVGVVLSGANGSFVGADGAPIKGVPALDSTRISQDASTVSIGLVNYSIGDLPDSGGNGVAPWLALSALILSAGGVWARKSSQKSAA